MDAKFDEEGYWCTGDVFERKHNKLFYKSRKKDLIKVNSFNVSPVGIENAMLVIEGVDEVCVIDEDRGLGEKNIIAIVSTQDPKINKSYIMEVIKDKLMYYEIPKDIIIIDKPLPRNQMGKVQRHVVKQEYGKGI